jgi:hypothetical protein
MTLARIMPINLAVLRWDEEHGDRDGWRQLRRRWDRTTPRVPSSTAQASPSSAPAAVWR